MKAERVFVSSTPWSKCLEITETSAVLTCVSKLTSVYISKKGVTANLISIQKMLLGIFVKWYGYHNYSKDSNLNILYIRCKPGLHTDVQECIFASWHRFIMAGAGGW